MKSFILFLSLLVFSYNVPIPTPHISAKKGDFAETVLMPGDPKRSKFIAEKYLENPVLVNDVRGVQGYTGTYKGKRVSVMASGMGMPAIGIYSYELFSSYDVKNIIRVGSAGSLNKDIHIKDLVVGVGASTNSNFAATYGLTGTISAIASFDLLRKADIVTKKLGLEKHITLIFFCFSQELRFSYWSEKNISRKQQIFTKPGIIFTFFLGTV